VETRKNEIKTRDVLIDMTAQKKKHHLSNRCKTTGKSDFGLQQNSRKRKSKTTPKLPAYRKKD